MKATPLISCIIIFYNAELFIRESIESILAQTYQAWELLLVDDGSTDGSTAVARQFAELYPDRIHYVEHDDHQNRGMSASRNLGIQYAKGEYIAFLDADDIWLPLKLEQQVEILNSFPEAAMVYGRTLIWYSWTGKPNDIQRDNTLKLGVLPNNLVKPPALFLLLLQNKVQTPTTCNAMIRREAFAEVGGFIESFRDLYEDQVFFSKLLLKKPVYVAEHCWAKYRQHPASSSSILSSNITDYCASRMPFLNWLSEYLLREGIERETEIWRALQKERWLCRYPGLLQMLHYLWHSMDLMKGFLKHGV